MQPVEQRPTTLSGRGYPNFAGGDSPLSARRGHSKHHNPWGENQRDDAKNGKNSLEKYQFLSNKRLKFGSINGMFLTFRM